MEPQMQYKQGDRVSYRNDGGHACQGTVQRVEGSGQMCKYTIMNNQTTQLEEVTHSRVEGAIS